jgi:hypothetical protein
MDDKPASMMSSLADVLGNVVGLKWLKSLVSKNFLS